MVRVLFKSISPMTSFVIEFPDPNVKIADVRGKIAESHGENFKADLLKLIFNGKTLQDEQKLSELKGIESKFIVIMKKAEEVKKETEPKVATATSKPTTVTDEVKAAIDEVKATIGGDTPPAAFETVTGHPGWQALQEMVQQDPYALPELIAQFLEGAPELAQTVAENQERFLQMLVNMPAPLATSSAPIAAPAAVAAPSTASAAAVTVPAAAPPTLVATNTSSLFTEADREIMRGMIGMGFPESRVYEAFAVCDKNEEMAINYILNMEAPNTGERKKVESKAAVAKEQEKKPVEESKPAGAKEQEKKPEEQEKKPEEQEKKPDEESKPAGAKEQEEKPDEDNKDGETS